MVVAAARVSRLERPSQAKRVLREQSRLVGAEMLLSLIMLTQLDGHPVWVESTAVQAVRPAIHSHCQASHGAAIRLSGIGLCVKETPDQVREKIRSAK